jgi:ATP-dependent Lon protease
VIKESAELALSWVRAHAVQLGLPPDPLAHPRAIDVHMHLPAGAQRKDGPSAGVAMVCALVGLLTGLCVPTDVAMTGEVCVLRAVRVLQAYGAADHPARARRPRRRHQREGSCALAQ